MNIQEDKDFVALSEIAKLYQLCKERDLTIVEREYLKGARDAWQAAKSQAVSEGFVLVPFDVVDRCMSHICLAMCHQNNSNSENDVMQTDLEILESSIEAQRLSDLRQMKKSKQGDDCE